MLHRRTVLKGIAATLTLPFLPSLAWAADPKNALTAPRRFVSLVNGDGYHPSNWWAKGAGASFELGPTLKSFMPFKDQVTMISGLHHERKMALVHGYGFTTMLSCEYAPSGKIQAGISLDQLLAKHYGKHTPIPSLVFGVDPVRGGMVNGAPSIYQATCSWSSPSTPIPPEHLPLQAFNRLFDVSQLKEDKSILDFVLKDANAIKKNVSIQDRHKLEEYYNSIREIEKRIESATSDEPRKGWQPTLDKPNMQAPQPGVLKDRTEHTRLMMDILSLALQMDKTRVATMVLLQDFSSARFNFIKGVRNADHHAISHHLEDKSLIAEYAKVNAYLADQTAYLVNKLASIQEGETTLLDNTLIFYGSSMFDGNAHAKKNIPIVLIGGKTHGHKGGRLFAVDPSLNELGNLHLTIAKQQGLDINRVGEGNKVIPGIFT
ncbi:MAG: DUF1552 domain-containing protein [Planctomycetes bacterium]|nr:DUF1552 domain-containing protein [Planctomycetota bacterium]